mmetsp:Transcript_15457/g.23993  ORF Transcript_15457/g.23993 Transcript_15457/m.23993 type:complete len:255 (-) Transcript_15457:581-1345(-)
MNDYPSNLDSLHKIIFTTSRFSIIIFFRTTCTAPHGRPPLLLTMLMCILTLARLGLFSFLSCRSVCFDDGSFPFFFLILDNFRLLLLIPLIPRLPDRPDKANPIEQIHLLLSQITLLALQKETIILALRHDPTSQCALGLPIRRRSSRLGIVLRVDHIDIRVDADIGGNNARIFPLTALVILRHETIPVCLLIATQLFKFHHPLVGAGLPREPNVVQHIDLMLRNVRFLAFHVEFVLLAHRVHPAAQRAIALGH